MKFKIIHIYIVEANDRNEAREKLALAKKAGKDDQYFESDVVKKVEEGTTGWLDAFKKQVGGK